MSRWGTTPRQSVLDECQRRGTGSVVDGCVAILTGGDPEPELLVALAGPAADAVLRGEWGGLGGYWPRVWALRGLLYAWAQSVAVVAAVLVSADDDAWRVREMALKVVAKHRVADVLAKAAERTGDPVPRVRRAAERALEALTDGGASSPDQTSARTDQSGVLRQPPRPTC